MNEVEKGEGARNDSEVLGLGDVLTSSFIKNKRSCLKDNKLEFESSESKECFDHLFREVNGPRASI